MPKERAPISSRLRNRDKGGTRLPTTQEVSKDKIKRKEATSSTHNQVEVDENVPFSPRADPNIYMDELQSPLSFVRGSQEERNQFVTDENQVMSQSFGSDYRSTLHTSTFYQARVSAPVPSKRSRHLAVQTNPPSENAYWKPTKRLSSEPSSQESPIVKKRTKISSSISPSPSLSSPSSTLALSMTATPSLATPLLTASKENGTHKAGSSGSNTAKAAKSICLSKSVKKAAAEPLASQQATAKKDKVSKSASPSQKASNKKISPMPNHHTQNQTMPTSTSRAGMDEQKTAVPLPLCKKLPVTIKMDPKDKEREYWRRQRRAFVHSRFFTHEEGVQLAKTVYSNLVINTAHRTVTSMQGNMSNFRTKLRKTIDAYANHFDLSLEYLTNPQEQNAINDLTAKMTAETLQSIWNHWISDPFVNFNLFYADSNKKSIDLLRHVTVQLVLIHFKEQYNIYTQKEARTKIRELDSISRKIVLPDTSEHP